MGRKWLDLPMSSYVLQGLTVSLWSRLQLRRCSIHSHWATTIRQKITHQHADIMACWFPCETISHFLWVQSCFIICDALCHLPIAAPLFFGSGNQEENQTTLLEPNELQIHVRWYNYRTTALISHASKIMLKSFKLGFSSTWTKNFHMYKLDLEKAEEPEINFQHTLDHIKKPR